MPAQPIYIPILKGKEGEFAALEVLATDVRDQLMPLIEIPAVPYDYANERPAKSLDEHMEAITLRLQKCCANRSIFLDLPWFGTDEHLTDGRTAFEVVLGGCATSGVTAVPVISRSSSVSYIDAAEACSAKYGTGACIRLLVEDFEEDIDLEAEVNVLLNELGFADATSVDLVIDLEDLGREATRAILVARSVLSTMPRKMEWRRIILAAASFPEDLSDVDAATTVTLPRHEWDLWKALQRRPGALPRTDIMFSDYAIAHPFTKELDPRTMRMSANIRYTTRDSWLVVKGRNVRQYGFSQYFELCKALVERPEYCGQQYSWGDNYIAECATAGKTGPGNATTWRKVGVNHHLTLVTRELANLRDGA